MDKKQRNRLIVLFMLILGIGQFIFIFLNHSNVIWEYRPESSSGHTGETTLYIRSSPFHFNRYAIQASGRYDFSDYPGSSEQGYIIFTHKGTGKINFYYSKDKAEIRFGVFREEKKCKIYNVSLFSRIPESIFKKISYDKFFNLLNNKTFNQEKLREWIKQRISSKINP